MRAQNASQLPSSAATMKDLHECIAGFRGAFRGNRLELELAGAMAQLTRQCTSHELVQRGIALVADGIHIRAMSDEMASGVDLVQVVNEVMEGGIFISGRRVVDADLLQQPVQQIGLQTWGSQVAWVN